MPSLVSKCAPTSCKCSTFLNDFPSRNVEEYIFPTLRPPLPSSRRGPPKMRRGCTISAGVPGSSWRPFPEHSSLPPPSTQRPTGPKRPTARERGGRGKKCGIFPIFLGASFWGPSVVRHCREGARPPEGGGIYLFFQSALTGTPHCTPPSVNHARSAAASWREDSRIFLRFSEIWPFQKRVILETTVHQTLSEIGPIDAVTLRNA